MMRSICADVQQLQSVHAATIGSLCTNIMHTNGQSLLVAQPQRYETAGLMAVTADGVEDWDEWCDGMIPITINQFKR